MSNQIITGWDVEGVSTQTLPTGQSTNRESIMGILRNAHPTIEDTHTFRVEGTVLKGTAKSGSKA